MGFRPQKHDFSVLGVKYPLFNLKGPFFFVSSNSKSNNESIQKQVCAPLEKMGIWPQKH